MKNKYVICAHRPWNIKLFDQEITKLGEFHLIQNKEELTIEKLDAIGPKIVFFLDWSWIVKKDITDRFFCVGFHSAPLPEFRGGSPIQNQIIRGIKKTKLTAFKMDGGIDTGNILVQEDLDLSGHLMDIFERITNLSTNMILKIINGQYKEIVQSGMGSYYKRRKPSESELYTDDFNKDIVYLNDFIRMLEDPYPNAFYVLGNKKIIFKSSKILNGKLNCDIIVEEIK